jgi:hypothetical protein
MDPHLLQVPHIPGLSSSAQPRETPLLLLLLLLSRSFFSEYVRNAAFERVADGDAY